MSVINSQTADDLQAYIKRKYPNFGLQLPAYNQILVLQELIARVERAAGKATLEAWIETYDEE